jgi:mannose-6-phosphate isomerase-like protein (cupin superfamily)
MITETLPLAKKNFAMPDVNREFDHGRLELATVADTTLGRFTLQPGWKWSESIRPAVGTERCQAQHLQYVIRGRLRVVQDDGSEMDLEPGDFASIPPGHDAWVVGDEPFVCIELSHDLKRYAQAGDSARH